MSSQKSNTNTRTTKASYAMNPVKQEKLDVQTQNKFQALELFLQTSPDQSLLKQPL